MMQIETARNIYLRDHSARSVMTTFGKRVKIKPLSTVSRYLSQLSLQEKFSSVRSCNLPSQNAINYLHLSEKIVNLSRKNMRHQKNKMPTNQIARNATQSEKLYADSLRYFLLNCIRKPEKIIGASGLEDNEMNRYMLQLVCTLRWGIGNCDDNALSTMLEASKIFKDDPVKIDFMQSSQGGHSFCRVRLDNGEAIILDSWTQDGPIMENDLSDHYKDAKVVLSLENSQNKKRFLKKYIQAEKAFEQNQDKIVSTFSQLLQNTPYKKNYAYYYFTEAKTINDKMFDKKTLDAERNRKNKINKLINNNESSILEPQEVLIAKQHRLNTGINHSLMYEIRAAYIERENILADEVSVPYPFTRFNLD